MKSFIVGLVFLASLSVFAVDEEIPLVGLDENDVPIESVVTKQEYQEKMSALLASVQQSTIPTLTQRNAGSGWRLRTVVVGIGTSVEVGVKSVLTLGFLPRFKVAFTNSSDPGLP